MSLVHGSRMGDVDAYGELVSRYQSAVFNVCYRIFGERREAEDMTQETFIRAYSRLYSFDPARPFGPWIRKVAANLCFNRLRGSSPGVLPFDDELDRPGWEREWDPEAKHIKVEQAAEIHAAILSLPAHQRAVIELRHYQELSYAEIAETLELPVSDVKSHLYRARKRLAERLRRDD